MGDESLSLYYESAISFLFVKMPVTLQQMKHFRKDIVVVRDKFLGFLIQQIVSHLIFLWGYIKNIVHIQYLTDVNN